jgi:hypothetical protein
MTTVVAILLVVAIPFVAVSALLRLAERLQDRRDLQRDRQIMLTDAIHWELGAVAAPVVHWRPGGGWRVSMAVPFDRPAVVAALLRVTARHFAAEKAAERLEIVLRPDTFGARPLPQQLDAPRQAATDTPLAA